MEFIIGQLYLIDEDYFFYIGQDDDKRYLFLSKDKKSDGLSTSIMIFYDGKNYRDVNSKQIMNIITNTTKTNKDDNEIYDKFFKNQGTSKRNSKDSSDDLFTTEYTD
jgi:hypothetical protein